MNMAESVAATRRLEGYAEAQIMAGSLSRLIALGYKIKLVRIPANAPIAKYLGVDGETGEKHPCSFVGYPAKITKRFEAQAEYRRSFDQVMNLCCEFLPEGYSLCFELYRQDGPEFYVLCPDGRKEYDFPSNRESIREEWIDAVLWAREDAGLRHE